MHYGYAKLATVTVIENRLIRSARTMRAVAGCRKLGNPRTILYTFFRGEAESVDEFFALNRLGGE